jgi:hypothetical protein
MKAHRIILSLILMFATAAFAQTPRTSRTKHRVHGKVDSVSTWGVTHDTASTVRDSLRKR